MNAYDIAQAKRFDRLLTKYRPLLDAVTDQLGKDEAFEVQSLELWTLPDSIQVYYFETPGHAWFFDVTTLKLVGEDDAGLETDGYKRLVHATIDTLI